MTVQIIRVVERNADLLNQVDPDVFDEAIDPRRVSIYVASPHSIMLVAVSDALVVGQLLSVIHHHPDKKTELYIDDLAVAPAFQRKGIATQMYRHAVELGKNLGKCEEIWVATEPENEKARALYQSLGLRQRQVVVFEGELP